LGVKQAKDRSIEVCRIYRTRGEPIPVTWNQTTIWMTSRQCAGGTLVDTHNFRRMLQPDEVIE